MKRFVPLVLILVGLLGLQCSSFANSDTQIKGSFQNLSKNEKAQFLALTNWKRRIRRIRIHGELKRQVFYRSMKNDSLFKNPILEFSALKNKFFNSSQLQCENMAIYQFMAHVFSEKPFSATKCNNEFSTFITTSSGFEELRFYKNRIVNIAYFMASDGEQAMSRFGHSMFYFRACREDLDDCPLADQVEFVVGVAADVDDLSPGLFKGIFGGYSAKIDFMNLAQVKQKYNIDEFRNVDQYDLNISNDEKLRLTAHIISQYENRDMGRYKFFSANCATESYKLLRATIDFNKLTSRILTPNGLLDELIKFGLVNKTPSRIFKEKSKKILSALHFLDFKSMEDYLSASVETRYKVALSKANQGNVRLARRNYILLEKMALQKAQEELLKHASLSEDRKLRKEFNSLAIEYKDWVRKNNDYVRMGKFPVKSDIGDRMTQFHLQHYKSRIEEINEIINLIRNSKKDFK